MKPIFLAAAALAAVALPPAGAQSIFKYVSPDGRVTYSQTSVPGARLVEELAPALQVSPAALDAARAKRAARDKALSDAADRRLQSLDEAANEMNVWTARLRDAQAALEAGREPLPGERTGVVYQGRSRLSETYWARQAANEAAVAEAEAHIQHARATIQALR
jgi:alkylation response protein AidB-like acyl-CoA dehydrogenase